MSHPTNNPVIIVHNLPHHVLAFIKARYPDGIITDMIQDYNVHGEFKYYDVDVADADNTYHLRFDKKGGFVHEEIEIGKIDPAESPGNPNDIEAKEPSVNDENLEEF